MCCFGGLLIKHAGTVRRAAYTQDRFQTFVFRSIATCCFVLLTAWSILVYYEQSASGCKGVKFTVLGHYSNADWMEEMYNGFRKYLNENYDRNVCFRLVIGEDTFDEELRPAIWNPHHKMWILLSDELTNAGFDYDRSCNETTAVPMGIVSWRSVVERIPPFMDQMTSFLELDAMGRMADNITYLQDLGYDLNFTNTPYEWVEGIDLSLARLSHGHPKVTSGGLLGIIGMILSLNGSISSAEDIFMIRNMEQDGTGYVYKDTDRLYDMVRYGPTGITAFIGFENFVIRMNQQFGDEMQANFNDSMAMVYLNETFWVQHPICSMKGMHWLEPEQETLADMFMDYVLNETRLRESLLRNALRPLEAATDTSILNDSVWNNNKNGVLKEMTVFDSMPLDPLFVNFSQSQLRSDLKTLLTNFNEVKKPVFLHLVIDVAEHMLISAKLKKTRWYFVEKHLDIFAERLEDNAIMHVSCIAGDQNDNYFLVSCNSDYDVHPEGDQLLGYHPFDKLGNETIRAQTSKLLRDDLSPKASQAQMHPFAALEVVYDQVNSSTKEFIQETHDNCVAQFGLFNESCSKYSYRIVLLTQNQKIKGKRGKAKEQRRYNYMLSNLTAQTPSPDNTLIYPILYWDASSGNTGKRLKDLATASGGRFFAAGTGIYEVMDQIFYFL